MRQVRKKQQCVVVIFCVAAVTAAGAALGEERGVYIACGLCSEGRGGAAVLQMTQMNHRGTFLFITRAFATLLFLYLFIGGRQGP